jgi:two-component system, NtrC family, C4-dicarboxylate transport response regulator DctD
MDNTTEKRNITIIVIDDDKDIRISTADFLSTRYKKIECYSSTKKVLPKISPELPAIILTDLRMPDDDGLEFAQKVRAIDPHLPVILMTGYGDVSTAVDAMKHGIYDFIEKPVDTERLMDTIARAIEKRLLTLSLSDTQEKLSSRSKIDTTLIGHSSVMQALKKNIIDFAPMNIPIVIYGETGTGKELVAHCLHDYSSVRENDFILLNCAAIPEELAEAELFGYVKGSFSDAPSMHKGKIAQAENGTLFLDEVDSLPLSTQAKLLLALANKTITPIGSNEQIPINCRIISATKEELRGNKKFRQDLFFSLQVAELRVPPLRHREEDIIELFNYFVMQHCENLKTEYHALNNDSRKKLLTYEWPGNVRELINIAIRYALKNCSDIDYAMKNNELDEFYSSDERSLKEQVEAYDSLKSN